MRQTVHNIPIILQQRILMQAALAAASLLLAVVLLFFFPGIVSIPFLLVSSLLAACAGHTYWAAVHNRVLALKGIVLQLERTVFCHRPKALLVEVEGKALRIVLHSRLHAPKAGEQITLFVLDSAQLYPWRGLQQLDRYLALATDELPDKT